MAFGFSDWHRSGGSGFAGAPLGKGARAMDQSQCVGKASREYTSAKTPRTVQTKAPALHVGRIRTRLRGCFWSLGCHQLDADPRALPSRPSWSEPDHADG